MRIWCPTVFINIWNKSDVLGILTENSEDMRSCADVKEAVGEIIVSNGLSDKDVDELCKQIGSIMDLPADR